MGKAEAQTIATQLSTGNYLGAQEALKMTLHKIFINTEETLPQQKAFVTIFHLLECLSPVLQKLAQDNPKPNHEDPEIRELYSHCWTFFLILDAGLKEIVLQDPEKCFLQKNFISLCQLHLSLTTPVHFLLENLSIKYKNRSMPFSERESKYKDFIFVDEDEEERNKKINRLFQHVLIPYAKHTVFVRETTALATLSNIIKGYGWAIPTSVSALKHDLISLFDKYPNPDRKVTQLLDQLFDEYIKPNLYSTNTRSYQLFAEYRPEAAQQWVESKIPVAESALLFIGEVFEKNIAIVHSEKLMNGIRGTLWSIKHCSTPQRNFLAMLHEKVNAYLDQQSTRAVPDDRYEGLIYMIDDPEISSRYRELRLRYLLKSSQFRDIFQEVEPRTVNLLIDYLQAQSRWSNEYLLLIDKLSDEHCQQVLSYFANNTGPWNHDLQKIIDEYGSLTLQQHYHLRWFEQLITGSASADNTLAHEKTEKGLVAFYGEENVTTLAHRIEAFFDAGTENERALSWIKEYLSRAYDNVLLTDSLQKKFLDYQRTLEKNHRIVSAIDDLTGFLEAHRYQEATQRVKLIVKKLEMYTEDDEKHHEYGVILDKTLEKIGDLARHLIAKHQRCTLVLLTHYFLSAFPESELKHKTQQLCQAFLDSTAENTIDPQKVFEIFKEKAEKFDSELFAALRQDEPSLDDEDMTTLLAIRDWMAIRDQMASQKIANPVERNDLTLKEKALLLRYTNRLVHFFNLPIRDPIETMLRASSHIKRYVNTMEVESNIYLSIEKLNLKIFKNSFLVTPGKVRDRLKGKYNHGVFSHFKKTAVGKLADPAIIASRKQAIQRAKLAIENNGADLEAYYTIATAKLDLGKLHAASHYFDRVIELNPKHALAYYYRAHVRDEIGYFMGAVIDLTKAIQIKPDWMFLYNIGTTFYIKLKKSIDALIKGTLVSSDHAKESHHKLVAIFNTENIKKITDCEQILTGPQAREASVLCGYAKYLLQDYKGAIITLNRAIGLETNDFTAYLYRGMVNVKLRQYDDAAYDLMKAVECDACVKTFFFANGDVEKQSYLFYQDHKHFYFCAALTKKMCDDFSGAIKDFSEVIKLDPKNADAYQQRGLIYLRCKQYKQAIADFNHVISITPDHTEADYYRELSEARHSYYNGIKHFGFFNRVVKHDPSTDTYYEGGLNSYSVSTIRASYP